MPTRGSDASGADPLRPLPAPERAAAISETSGPIWPTIVFYSLQDAVAALRAAAECGIPVRLQGSSAVAASLGPEVAWAIFQQARAAVPRATATCALDCDDQPGLAMAALRAGIPVVRIDLPPKLRDKIADIAVRCLGAVESRGDADVLDLAEMRDSFAACRKWLSEWTKTSKAPRESPLPSFDGSCI